MDKRVPMMKHMMKTFVFLIFIIPLASPVTHSLQYFYTGVTPGINLPEFSRVGLVDGEQFVYYDSNIRRDGPKTEWIKKIVEYEAGYWDRLTKVLQGWEETMKADVDILMKRFNQTRGIHTVQLMYGCELHDDGTTTGYDQYGYDGEDFLILDMKTATYIAPTSQALITKLRWDPLNVGARNKAYAESTCIEWLRKYVEYGRSTLERKVPPEVSVFQRDSSSTVVCHATGFFPKEVMISWQKNGEDVEEEVEVRETLRNQDGSFQKRSILTVSPEELNKDQFTCVVQHSALDKEMVMKVSRGGMGGMIIGAVVAVLLLGIIAGVGVFIWKKKCGPYKKTPSEDTNSDKSADPDA